MNDIIPRAKEVGLRHIREWLPHGRQEGDEWVCHNPNLGTKNLGSFKINIKTGSWADFSEDQKGRDVVSLYAYLYRFECESLIKGRPSNYEGLVQVKAAEEILKKHDTMFLPGDNYKIPEVVGGYWEGFKPVGRPIKKYPDIKDSLAWHIKKHGQPENIWSGFTDKNGLVLLHIVRFRDEEGKKSDRPFSLWTNGSEYRWRAKCYDGSIPLYGLPKILENVSLPVLMVEGQKCAHMGNEVLDWPVTTIYRHVDKCDLEPLRGRIVYYWWDSDPAGQKKLKAVKKALKDLDVDFRPIRPPRGVKAGWSIDDAIDEGWTPEKIKAHVESQVKKASEVKYLDDNDFPFKIIGLAGNLIYFLSRETQTVITERRNSLNKVKLMAIMDKTLWESYFVNEKGVAWDDAINFIMRESAKAPSFKKAMIRGAGAWKDDGKMVLNCGDRLLVDGEPADMFDFDSDYIYERNDFIPYSTEGATTTEEAGRLLSIVKKLSWKNSLDALLLCGWILLAPFGGALSWRPKVWVSGAKGSGKSWCLDEIIIPLCGTWFGNVALGTSSEAAIRRKAGMNSIPNIHDEMESDRKKLAENIDDILMFYRVGSSGDGNSIIKVGDGGQIDSWVSQCMACFASIGASIKHGADRSRITILRLINSSTIKPDHVRAADFEELQQLVKLFTKEWVVSFHSRTLSLWNQVEESVDMFRRLLSTSLGDQRTGDQIGTLLAGAWMISHDRAPIMSEASEWVKSLKIEDLKDSNTKSDEELCLDEILNHQIEMLDFNGFKSTGTVGYFLHCYFYSYDQKGFGSDDIDLNLFPESFSKIVKKELASIGINPVKNDPPTIQIAGQSHVGLRRILKDTAWSSNYTDILQRLEASSGSLHGPGWFGSGVRKRYLSLNAKLVLLGVPF
jgi:putative DNA primase/helicase